MQRFLGMGGFFSPFLPHYATLTAPLHDMLKKTFNWNKSTWAKDYAKYFEEFKEALKKATALFYPDYDLDWLLRAAASDLGVGIVLLQCFVKPDSTIVLQPNLFSSFL